MQILSGDQPVFLVRRGICLYRLPGASERCIISPRRLLLLFACIPCVPVDFRQDVLPLLLLCRASVCLFITLAGFTPAPAAKDAASTYADAQKTTSDGPGEQEATV